MKFDIFYEAVIERLQQMKQLTQNGEYLLRNSDKFRKFIIDTARQSGLPGINGGAQDAMRHLILAAELIRLLGPVSSTAVLQGREMFSSEKDKRSKALTLMDIHNNRIGIEIGRKAKDFNEVVLRVRNRMRKAKKHNGSGGFDPMGNLRVHWVDKDLDKPWPSDWDKRPIIPYNRSDAKHKYGAREIVPKNPTVTKSSNEISKAGLTNESEKSHAFSSFRINTKGIELTDTLRSFTRAMGRRPVGLEASARNAPRH